MKILVVSDIHSNLVALEAVLEDAGHWDAAISAGDIVGYGPNPEECIDRLYFKGFRCVLGNHDNAVATIETDWFNDDAQDAIKINRSKLTLASLRWLGRLPIELKLELDGYKISVYHGSPTEPLTSYIYPDSAKTQAENLLSLTGSDILILGHTHVPYMIENDSHLMLNPGSVGQPRDGDPRASYILLETEPLRVEHRRVEYNIDVTAEAIDALGLPHKFATRLYWGN
ncbi:MAG: metallophosphoesterase family protein [Candidatus Bathyarchaeia archaeon]|jgi:putative phosphoesterase